MSKLSIASLVFTGVVIVVASVLILPPYRSKDRILALFDRGLSCFEDWTLLISVLVALIALFFNVVLRYGFNYTLAWSEELVREVIIYTTFIGCCAAVKKRSMIKIDATVQLLPILKKPLLYFSNSVTLIFSLLLMIYGWEIAAMQARTFQKTVIMQVPLVYLYAILPLTGMLMFIRTLQIVSQDLGLNASGTKTV